MARFLFSAKCLQMNAKGCNFASEINEKEEKMKTDRIIE